jgi:hypothetical protein
MSERDEVPHEQAEGSPPPAPIKPRAAGRPSTRRTGPWQIVLFVSLVVLIGATFVLTVIILADRPAVSLDRAKQASESVVVAHDKQLSPTAVTLERVVLRLEPGKPWKGIFSARGALPRCARAAT